MVLTCFRVHSLDSKNLCKPVVYKWYKHNGSVEQLPVWNVLPKLVTFQIHNKCESETIICSHVHLVVSGLWTFLLVTVRAGRVCYIHLPSVRVLLPGIEGVNPKDDPVSQHRWIFIGWMCSCGFPAFCWNLEGWMSWLDCISICATEMCWHSHHPTSTPPWDVAVGHV